MGQIALQVWALFGGEIDWAALPWVASLVGCDDLDALTHLLTVIRDYK